MQPNTFYSGPFTVITRDNQLLDQNLSEIPGIQQADCEIRVGFDHRYPGQIILGESDTIEFHAGGERFALRINDIRYVLNGIGRLIYPPESVPSD